MSGRIYLASLVALSLLIAVSVSWPAFLIVAAVWLLIAVALLWSERGELQAELREAQRIARQSQEAGNVIADEQQATHAANEILCAELAESDAKIRRLSRDLLAANTRISDLLNDAEHAPAPVIPLPVQREASPYDWPQNTDDAVWQALYDTNGDQR